MKLRDAINLLRLRLSALPFVLAIAAISSVARAEDYRLQPGDVLKMMIVGALDFERTVPVEMDGFAWFPLIGPIQARGMSLNDIRTRAAVAYATMSIASPFEPGRGLPRDLEQSQVHVTVAEYRPVYLTGDVAEPREILFRPGLTLHQVVSLASRPVPTGSRSASTGEIEAAATELGGGRARVWRLKRFLGNDTPEDFDRILVTDLPAIHNLVDIEEAVLTETGEILAERKQHLGEELARTEAQIVLLERQRENEAEALELDEATAASISGLPKTGVARTQLLAEVRRAALATASRVLQVDVAIESARSRAADLRADIRALDSDARSEAWKQLSDAVTLEQARQSRLEGLLATLGAADRINSLETKSMAIIIRAGVIVETDEGPEGTVELQPGDIVEIHRVFQSKSDN